MARNRLRTVALSPVLDAETLEHIDARSRVHLLAGVLSFMFCFLAVVAMIGLLYYRKPAARKPVSYNDRNAQNHKTTGSLTVVLGESGAGKTTLIHDVHAQCGGGVIVRQYHAIRPGQFVQELPDLDISRLPFEINPGKRVGGSLATGVVIPGLSGGQRKMLIFEIVYQRLLVCMEPLLVLMDEPFAGITKNNISFLIDSCVEIKKRHHLFLVTNDHITELRDVADAVITVDAMDRSTIDLNGAKV
jgi:hypothetical protein